jgi:predicted RNase H-like nuclease (RuvC/YqgF family)
VERALSSKLRPEQAITTFRSLLRTLRDRLMELVARIDELLGLPPGPTEPPDPGDDDTALLKKTLDQFRQSLAEARQRLFDAKQDKSLAQRALAEREQHIVRQQAQIADLQRRIDELETRLRDAEQRQPIEPAGLGSALGNAVDAIQQGLTSLDNPLIDYGLQQLDLETQVNLEIGSNGRLLIRFPGLNEAVNPQNLSRVCLRLQPIPKGQVEPAAAGGPPGA